MGDGKNILQQERTEKVQELLSYGCCMHQWYCVKSKNKNLNENSWLGFYNSFSYLYDLYCLCMCAFSIKHDSVRSGV